MNLSTASKTFQLLTRILDTRSSTEPFLPPAGEKRPLPLQPAEQPFPRTAPESQGIPSGHIQSFLEELERDCSLAMHSVLVLRNGSLLCAAAFRGQRLDAPKYTFSACKSVVSLAVGLLEDDGLLGLDEKVVDIFEDLCPAGAKRRLKDLTVEDLLTMRPFHRGRGPDRGRLDPPVSLRLHQGRARRDLRLQQSQHLHALRHCPSENRRRAYETPPEAPL